MKTLTTIGLAAAISILSLNAQADSFRITIDQVAKTDATYMNQRAGQGNTQAMNAVDLKYTKGEVSQKAKSDIVRLVQSGGQNNLQALNVAKTIESTGTTIEQKVNVDKAYLTQRGGTNNTQALNYVKTVR